MERKHKGLNHLITLEVSNNGQFNEVRLHIPPHRKLGHSDQNYPELEWPHLAVVQRLGTGPTSLWYRDWELAPPRCGTETGNWPHLAVVQRLGTGPTSLWYRDWEQDCGQ